MHDYPAKLALAGGRGRSAILSSWTAKSAVLRIYLASTALLRLAYTPGEYGQSLADINLNISRSDNTRKLLNPVIHAIASLSHACGFAR